MTKKPLFKKIWQFIWNEDSLLSWVINIILAFVIIKFLLYPGLGLVLGTQAPIVAVVSGSMEHDAEFDKWWNEPSCCDDQCIQTMIQGDYYEQAGVSKEEFMKFPSKYGFDKGDIMFLHNNGEIITGDVIVYSIKEKADPIIHRVIDIKEENGKKYYFTKGDHNCGIASFEKAIPEERIIGKSFLRIPFLGWIKIGFVKIISLFMR